jgi:hypothetical protein
MHDVPRGVASGALVIGATGLALACFGPCSCDAECCSGPSAVHVTDAGDGADSAAPLDSSDEPGVPMYLLEVRDRDRAGPSNRMTSEVIVDSNGAWSLAETIEVDSPQQCAFDEVVELRLLHLDGREPVEGYEVISIERPTWDGLGTTADVEVWNGWMLHIQWFDWIA